MMKCPSSTKKHSSSFSCLCQWYSPCITPRRTTESLTLQRVWLYHLLVTALMRAGASTTVDGGNFTSRNVAYGNFVGSLMPWQNNRAYENSPRRSVTGPGTPKV